VAMSRPVQGIATVRTADASEGLTGASTLAVILAMVSGCAEETSATVPPDAGPPPIDAGMDATDGDGLDAQALPDADADASPDARDAPETGHLCPADGGSGDGAAAPSDGGADDSPTACTPAACEPTDGGADAERPPWGCPEACDPPCEGDTVCCESGSCQRRSYHECKCGEGCDVELTLIPPLLCLGFPAGVNVCNRGASGVAPAGQLVRFEEDGGEVVCETETPEPLGPCECIRAECAGTLEAAGGSYLVITVNPDGPGHECGNPYGNTVRRQIWVCD
jgi:hypothetical protein